MRKPVPRGGRRDGAGRPAGRPNSASAARQQRISETGITPLEHLLAVMRDENTSAVVRLDAAKAAAPYVHPKLAAVQSEVSLTGRLTLEELVLQSLASTVSPEHETG